MQEQAEIERSIMNKKFQKKVAIHSIILTIGPLLLYIWALNNGYALELSRTLSFTALAFTQLFHIFNARRESGIAFDKTVLENKYLWLSLLIGFVLQLAAIYLPSFQQVLSTTFIPNELWLPVIIAIVVPMLVIQFLNIQFGRRN